ncbi:MAG TPA: LptF/LptG family permease [Fimbriimonadaceae bacterium]|nr:LptF/LptG family permease [Fimbriimonadaceae bacterium]
MKRIDRYILKEMAIPMIVGTLVVALLFMANEFIGIFKNFEITRLPFTAILQMVLYRMPQWLSLTLPSGTAIGVALAVSRLARESEITAMRAAGVPLRRIFLPILVVGALVSVGNFLIVEKLIPPASKQYRNVTGQASMVASAPAFKSNVMLQLDRYTANFREIQRTKGGSILLKGIVIFERPKAEETVLFIAEDGSYDDGVWTINKPDVYTMHGADLVAFRVMDKATINERVRVADVFSPPVPDEETAAALKKAIEQRRANRIDTTVLEVAYQVKFSLPASCLVFALASAAFAVSMMRSGPFVGLIVSMGLVMLFYNIHVISTQIFGPNGWLPPVAAAWLPDVVYALVTLVLIWRAE